MADEIYLQQGTQFHSGEWIGADENSELFKGVVAFMINGLRDRRDYKRRNIRTYRRNNGIFVIHCK